MKIQCSRDKLIQSLQHTEKIPRKNLSLPILSKVLLETSGNLLILKATNLGVGVATSLPAIVTTQGVVAIDGGLLLQVLQQVKRVDKVTLEQVEGELRLEAESVSAVVQVYPVEDFPTLPRVEDGVKMNLPLKSFVSGIKSVAYSAASNDIKPEIASVYMYSSDKDLLFVATDSFRLAEKKIKDVVPAEGFDPLMFPASSIQDVVRVVEGLSGDIEMTIGDNLVEMVSGGVSITQRLVTGSFPDYRLIIPSEYESEALVLKQELVDQLRLVTLFSDKFQQLDIEIDPENKKLQISATNSDVGSGKVQVFATLKGGTLEARLNHRYLLDGFQSINDDSVELLFAGERKPVVLRGVVDKTFTYLVMPMNR